MRGRKEARADRGLFSSVLLDRLRRRPAGAGFLMAFLGLLAVAWVVFFVCACKSARP